MKDLSLGEVLAEVFRCDYVCVTEFHAEVCGDGCASK